MYPAYSYTDLPEIDWNQFWSDYWNNLRQNLRQKLLYELESPEERQRRILEEERLRAEIAQKAAWAPVFPAIITAGLTGLIVYLIRKREG